jgi:hypothetical protein
MPIRISDLIEQMNREQNLTGPGFFHLIHSGNVDFTVNGIVGTDETKFGSYLPVSYGQKYIIENEANWNAFSSSAALPSGFGLGDILQRGSSTWEIYLDASNSKSEGAIVYNKHDNKFYFYDGTNWVAVGTGAAGGGGDSGVTGIGFGDDVGLTGKVNITGDAGGVGLGGVYITRDGNTISVGLSAAGASTYVQYRDANGRLAGNSGLNWTNVTRTLVVGDIGSSSPSTSGKIRIVGSKGYLQFPDGTTQTTARNFFGLTGPTHPDFVKGISSSGHTGDRLLIATGPSANPFRTYVRYGNAWFQTNVAGVGRAGAQGTTGPTGGFDISGVTFQQNTGITHQSNDTLGTDTGRARKIMFLQDDGTLTFDYIRNYDVFKPTDFTFSVKTFTSNISSPVLIGINNYLLSDGPVTVNATYQFGPPITGNVYVINPTQGTGFPVYFPTSAMDSITFSSQTLTAAAGGSLVLRLEATGYTGVIGGPGRQVSTKDITISFANSFLYGVSGGSSLDGSSLGSGFTGNWVTRTTTNSIDQTFTVNVPVGQYIYFAFPERIGEATYQINDLGIGGFSPQGLNGVPGVSAQTWGNANGYREKYFFYRSINSGLGDNTKVDVAPITNPELL